MQTGGRNGNNRQPVACFAEDGVVHGVLPHVVVGDMDSAAPQHLDALQAAGAEVRRVSSQDENDLFKALNLAAAEYKQVSGVFLVAI